MQDRELHPKYSIRSLPVSVIAGLSTLVVLTGSATAWWAWNAIVAKHLPSKSSAPPITATTPHTIQPAQPESHHPIPNTTSDVPVEEPIQVYWLKDTGTHQELVSSSMQLDGSAPTADILKMAFAELIKGPKDPAMSSTIPQNTTVLNLDVRTDGVHVDLSREFVTGGGSASMTGRLAQVIYTATSIDPAANVWISVEGAPLRQLGGEGLGVSQPITRDEFKQNFSL